MQRTSIGYVARWPVVLFLALATAMQVQAQDGSPAYTRMAPLDAYLIADRNAEVTLARSAAPAEIARNATVLVLGRRGYETAATGTNGFVCLVERGWTGPFGWPEFWNPQIRAAACLNPQAARSILPITQFRARLVLQGRTDAQIVTALRAAFATRQLPRLEAGAMAYMMARDAYLTDAGEHNAAHVMFYEPVLDGADWGANVPGSPVMSSAFWTFSDSARNGPRGLQPMLVFLLPTAHWSDGSSAGLAATPADTTKPPHR